MQVLCNAVGLTSSSHKVCLSLRDLVAGSSVYQGTIHWKYLAHRECLLESLNWNVKCSISWEKVSKRQMIVFPQELSVGRWLTAPSIVIQMWVILNVIFFFTLIRVKSSSWWTHVIITIVVMTDFICLSQRHKKISTSYWLFLVNWWASWVGCWDST